MSASQRRKGASAERQVAALLQAWWGQLEPGCRFVRTPSSGGWASAGVRGEFRASGDIMTTAKRFPFCVEVKRREGWSLDRFLEGKSSPAWGWWEQAQKAAVEARKSPILFLRQNGWKDWIVVIPLAWSAGLAAGGMWLPDEREGAAVAAATWMSFQFAGPRAFT